MSNIVNTLALHIDKVRQLEGMENCPELVDCLSSIRAYLVDHENQIMGLVHASNQHYEGRCALAETDHLINERLATVEQGLNAVSSYADIELSHIEEIVETANADEVIPKDRLAEMVEEKINGLGNILTNC